MGNGQNKTPIFLNFVALKSGGGVQVGLDFLNHLKNCEDYEWHLLVTKNTPFDSISLSDGIASIQRAENNLIGRMKAEIITVRKIIHRIKPSIIFTLFGPSPLFIFDRSIKTISGCAYSNLFYPEIDFWKNSGAILKWKNKLLDVFRLFLCKRSDLVVFETEDLKNRSISIRGFKEDQSICIMPAVSTKIIDSNKKKYTNILSKIEGFKIVLISYYRYHKNIDTLPHIISELKSTHNIHNIHFILTTEPDHPGTVSLLQTAKQLGVQEHIHNLGPVPPEYCGEIYHSVNASILPSTLESFSNNIAESWACSIPLIITDRSWARSICIEGAIYIKHRDISDACEKIAELYRNDDLRKKIIQAGRERLNQFPSSKERFDAYIATLNCMTNKTQKVNDA